MRQMKVRSSLNWIKGLDLEWVVGRGKKGRGIATGRPMGLGDVGWRGSDGGVGGTWEPQRVLQVCRAQPLTQLAHIESSNALRAELNEYSESL